ncbi:MAG: T9SS type A sorting domain-containing protein [Nitrosopumilus sp.]|nr:T9SS type A sorting domain-containing protein [Nitrosopumilus sp.]
MTDNCGYWDSTYVVTTTQGTGCSFYEFVATATTTAWDPTGNQSVSSKDVSVYLDQTQWPYVPPTWDINFWENWQDPANTGGMAVASNPAPGVTVDVTFVDSTNQNPDTTQCDHNEFGVWRKFWGVTQPCQDSSFVVQYIGVHDTIPSIWTGFPVNPLYVPYPQSIHPDNTGYPSGEDTITGMPATSTWVDSITNQTSTQVDIDRYWTLWDQCMTPTDDSIQVIYQEVMPGTPEQPKKQPIVVYPNPTQNLVHVKFNDIKARPEKIQISNLLGKTLEEIMVDPVEEVEYNASHLPDGMYIMSIGNKKRKFIKN